MKTEQGPFGWVFWRWWVVATAVGLFLSGAVGFTLGLSLYLTFLTAAATVGVVQWLVLRKHISQSALWILTSIAGGAAASAARAIASESMMWPLGDLWSWPFAGALAGGTVAGITQSVLLRKNLSAAAWWVLSSIVGWTAGVVLGWISVLFIGVSIIGFRSAPKGAEVVVAAVAFAIGGVVYGAITGAALARLLRQPAPEVQEK